MLSKKVFKSGYDVSKGSDLAQSEKNDCFVRACANAFNTTYEVAHRFVSENFKISLNFVFLIGLITC